MRISLTPRPLRAYKPASAFGASQRPPGICMILRAPIDASASLTLKGERHVRGD